MRDADVTGVQTCALPIYTGAQIDHQPVFTQRTTIGLAHDHTAASGQNDTPFLHQLGDHGFFTLTKAVLPFHIEDPGNIGSGSGFDLPVRILEGITKLLGQHAPDGTLSCTHRAYQKHITQRDYLARLIAPLLMIRGVRNTSSSVLLSYSTFRRNARPTTGRSPRKGTLSKAFCDSLENTPPITMVSPSATRILALTSFLRMVGTPLTT